MGLMEKIPALLIFLCWAGFSFSQKPTSFYFKEPQPASVQKASGFPVRFQGTYTNVEDSISRLIINDTMISRVEENIRFTLQSVVDTVDSLTVKDQYLYGMKQGDSLYTEASNDTLYFYYPQHYRSFRISDEQVLKVKGDRLFLNYRAPTGYWSLMTLRLKEKGALILKSFDHEKVMDRIRDIPGLETKAVKDIKTYLANPAERTLLELVRSKGFERTERYFDPG